MYDEMVRDLRDDADWAEKYAVPTILLYEMRRAADAIEDLSMKLHGDEAAIAGMKREIERMVRAEKPRWISVTERLPDKSGNYLTAFEDGTAMAVNEFMHPRDWLTEEGRKANPNGKWYWGGVTHWMTLPTAPEPQEEEA